GALPHSPRTLVEAPLAVGTELTLPAAKAHHLRTVLRLGAGAPLRLFNGDGREYSACLTRAARDQVEVVVEAAAAPLRESPLDITLAQAIARGDRMDFAIAKAIELGVHNIQPMITARAKDRLAGERLEKKHRHWQRVATSAAEQSGRLAPPRVAPALALDQFLQAQAESLRLVLAPSAGVHLHALEPARAIALLVGPESGF